jgi:hypothetical protein
MPPLGCAGLADGVLVSEQAHLVECVGGVYSVEPFHAHKVLGLLGVVGCGSVKRAVLQHVECGAIAVGCGHREVFGGLHGLKNNA